MISWQRADGRTLSCTSTFAVQVATFPDTSVTVNVTGLSPICEQLKVFGLSVIEKMAQLSKLPLSTSPAATTTFPVTSNSAMMSWQIGVGGILSTIVTVAVQVETFPFTSVTVNTTKFVPKSLQSKTFGTTVKLAMAQLSKLPPSI